MTMSADTSGVRCCRRWPTIALVLVLLGHEFSTVTAQTRCAFPPDASGHRLGGHVNIPSNVTSIGSWAFAGCSMLVSVDIPNTVTTIGNMAFAQCTSLRLPSSVTSIGEEAFPCFGFGLQLVNNVSNNPRGTVQCIPCANTAHITVPDNVTSIGEGAFYGCGDVISVSLPNNLTWIGNGAFELCGQLSTVNIPRSVPSIGASTFNNCDALMAISIPNVRMHIDRRVSISSVLCSWHHQHPTHRYFYN
jgi:hypothetical protein